jgi:hypothetical protein
MQIQTEEQPAFDRDLIDDTITDSPSDVVEFDIDVSDLEDARKCPRVPLYARIELPWHASRAVRARDISMSGIRALSRDGRLAHFAGERLHVRFRLPGMPETMEATARVVAQREAGNDLCVGLRFETLTPFTALSIYRFIQARS